MPSIELYVAESRHRGEPTDEQQKIIRSERAVLMVSASAGSGKTRVLVEKYLRHILDFGLRPDEILAITFTRKAAAEMKRRIVDRLTVLERFADAQIAETGPIQTIHGFCQRLLSENAIEAGIDPDFEILATGEEQRLLEQTIEEVLSQIPEEDEEALALVRKIAGKRSYSESLSPHGLLDMAIRVAITRWRGTGVNPSELAHTHGNHFQLLRLWQDRLLEQTPDEIRAAFYADSGTDEFGAKLVSAYKAAKLSKPSYIRASVEGDIAVAKDACGLMQLVVQAWTRYEGKMRTIQKLDFTALEAAGLRLLQQSESTRERIRAQYKVVLVDESQDLNPVQHELLEEMGPGAQMFVGDPQQSIYGFRQAEPALFARKLTREVGLRLSRNHRSTEGILSFIDHVFSQRWHEGYVPMSEGKPVPFEGVELWPQKQKDTDLAAQWVADFVDEWTAQINEEGRHRKSGEIAILVRQSAYGLKLLARLECLGVACRVSGGTEQFYARLEVRDLANVLEALTEPSDSFALWAVLRSPFVGLSLDALVLLTEPNSSLIERLEGAETLLPLSLAADLELIQYFRSWFEPLARHGDRMAAWEIIAELFARTPYLENLGRKPEAPQRLANVRKLLTLAANSPETGPREYAEQIREIQAIRHKEGDAPAGDQDLDEITIMTIHKSKGLEFPAVILPDTHLKVARGVQEVEVDPRLKLMTARFDRAASMFHDWLGHERKRREEEEEWRIMYVGMTRARERLCVIVNPQAGEMISNKLYGFLKKPEWPPAGVTMREASNLQR